MNFTCISCNKIFQEDISFIGKKYQCPHCSVINTLKSNTQNPQRIKFGKKIIGDRTFDFINTLVYIFFFLTFTTYAYFLLKALSG